MAKQETDRSLQLRSLVTEDGTLELSLASVDVPKPKDDEVVVRIEAAPINPSDLGLLVGFADLGTAKQSGTDERPVITASIPDNLMGMMSARLGESMPVGNEGAGVVVDAGTSPDAQALMGKTVAILGGATYAQHRAIAARDCLVLHEGTTPAEGASCFVNPLTVLGMVETMRMEGYTALVHTAAASNLGQMLNRVCINEGIDLVNIVRKPEHVDLLRAAGAKYVCDSSDANFTDNLTKALTETGATLAFDATGGGQLAGQILNCMETAANLGGGDYNRYGSTTHKQVYIYGGLDRSPTTLNRAFGMAWGIGGWLLTFFLIKIGAEETQKLKEKVADEVKTTFKSGYTNEISLAEALQLKTLAAYGKMATGEKYLINPNKA